MLTYAGRPNARYTLNLSMLLFRVIQVCNELSLNATYT